MKHIQSTKARKSTPSGAIRKYSDEDEEYQDLKYLIIMGFLNQKSLLRIPRRSFVESKIKLTIGDYLIVYIQSVHFSQLPRNNTQPPS